MSTYDYEQLGPDRFQHFCQALIATQFPDLTCFPVRQPDGGRDAMVLFKKGSTLVYQVKFALDPSSIPDKAKWLRDAVDGELKKINRLIKRGATKYILVTNVPGTAHLDGGSIDKVQSYLKSTISIEASVFWRNELDRRLDSQWDLKWSYPDLMTGSDMLRFIIEQGLSDNSRSRTNAIKSYIADQFEQDREVKFKQVELQNDLLELFIDVPIQRVRGTKSFSTISALARGIQDLADQNRHSHPQFRLVPGFRSEESNRPEIDFRDTRTNLARWILSKRVEPIPLLVIEGAPGHGKSTLAQYICQVHRMRILGKETEIAKIHPDHKTGKVRIPFKVDLRDFAGWLFGENPFGGGSNDHLTTSPSLETFLAAQISNHSGGSSFAVEDLWAIAAISPLLIVLDGLDEVAETDRRRKVVEEIQRALRRLDAQSLEIEIIVTSRPAAFLNSPGIPVDRYPYIELGSLDRPDILAYAKKWMQSRKLSDRERKDFMSVLESRLDEPHIRDLSRNPMQLAILLSLILTQGSSLPDKRTALYQSYVDRFFSRESEKSEIVRQYREVLIDVHRYLGWRLHAEAEKDGTGGDVEAERLGEILKDYLTAEKRDPTISDKLFTGVTQRVVMLVSRREGAYEFEVQPLREFFAAKYLYETAPYSPAGKEESGTLPERFDSLVKNSFWFNVCRFFAGCFNKGELPAIIEGIEYLQNDKHYLFSGGVFQILTTLISDYVFSQSPRTLEKAVNVMVGGSHLHLAMAFTDDYYASATHSWPIIRDTSLLFDVLANECHAGEKNHRRHQYINGINDAYEIKDIEAMFVKYLSNMASEENLTIEDHEKSHIVGLLEDLKLSPSFADDQAQLLTDAGLDQHEIDRAIYRSAFLELKNKSNLNYLDTAKFLLNDYYVPFNNTEGTLLQYLARLTDFHYYPRLYTGQVSGPANEIFSYPGSARVHELICSADTLLADKDSDYSIWGADADQIGLLIKKLSVEFEKPGTLWSSSIEPWRNSSNALFEVCPFCRKGLLISVLGAGIPDETNDSLTDIDFHDNTLDLTTRFRFARRKAGSNAINWWRSSIQSASTTESKFQTAMVMMCWATPTLAEKLKPEISGLLGDLSNSAWRWLFLQLRSIRQSTDRPNLSFIQDGNIASIGDERFMAFNLLFTPPSSRQKNVEKISKLSLSEFSINQILLGELCNEVIGGKALRGDVDNIIKEKYAQSGEPLPQVLGSLSRLYILRNSSESLMIDERSATKICSNPDKYPDLLLQAAILHFRRRKENSFTPIATTAEKDGWFKHDI